MRKILLIEGNSSSGGWKLTTFFYHLPLFSAIEIQFAPSNPNIHIHFNIILPSFPRSSKFFLCLKFARQTLIAFLFYDMHATCKANLIYSGRRRNKNITYYTKVSFFIEYFLRLFPYFSFVFFLFRCLSFICKEAVFLLPGRQSLSSPNQINNPYPAVQTDKYVSHSVRQLQQFAHTTFFIPAIWCLGTYVIAMWPNLIAHIWLLTRSDDERRSFLRNVGTARREIPDQCIRSQLRAVRNKHLTCYGTFEGCVCASIILLVVTWWI